MCPTSGPKPYAGLVPPVLAEEMGTDVAEETEQPVLAYPTLRARVPRKPHAEAVVAEAVRRRVGPVDVHPGYVRRPVPEQDADGVLPVVGNVEGAVVLAAVAADVAGADVSGARAGIEEDAVTVSPPPDLR